MLYITMNSWVVSEAMAAIALASNQVYALLCYSTA